jgi:hypothetical protein
MGAPAPSGYRLPASYAESYVQVCVDVLGRHGVDAMLRHGGLEAWLGRSPTLAEPVDFAELAAFLSSLEETLGARGYRGLARRMGSAAFTRVFRPVGAIAAMSDPAFQALPIDRRMHAGFYGLAKSLAAVTSAAVTTRDAEGRVVVSSEPCPDCWGRAAGRPICFPTIGLLSAAAAWIAPDAEAAVEESACRAQTAAACEFSIRWSIPDGGA